MEYSQLVRDILKNPNFSINKVCPSYVKRFLPELEDGPFLIFHKISKAVFTPVKRISVEDNDQTDADVTGSPLEYSFGRDSFNETVLPAKRYWLKEEEYHLPIDVIIARSALNVCLDSAKPDWKVQLIAVCNQEDKQKTVLLGTKINKKCHETILVQIQEPKRISEIANCSYILNEHLKMSSVKAHEVKIDTFCAYELFGTKESFTNFSEISKSNFEGYLCLQIKWNSLSFYPPSRQSTKTLIMEIAAGWKESPLDSLWEEILLLNRFLPILEEYSKKNMSSRYSVMPLKLPSDFNNPNAKSDEEVMDNLNRLLNGDNTFLENESVNLKKASTRSEDEIDFKLKQHLDDLSNRQNLDFTDYLWMIIKNSNNYSLITDCIHAVFQEVEKKDYKPQMNVANSTKISKLISEIMQQKAMSPLLAGSLPLEILIEIGIEKLMRDYTYILLSANLIDRHEVKQKLQCHFSEENYVEGLRKDLLTLAQIHICLEFMLLAQTHVDYPSGNLQSLFSCAYNKFTSKETPIGSFAPLEANSIYKLNVPIPNDIIKEVIEGPPSSWNVRLSSTAGITQITTGVCYSLTPIFPPEIYNEDEADNREQTYYAASHISSAYEI
ncbi:protein zwilch homolog [Leptopilina heterotoma]|uniref:protein zwilch homolog n=1 Tax=Leptopilina heterotoma TaxID=63436 RepID=UPI001CA800FE|nr:protein zwilch homolog [Leptopilina heterotoma]